MSELFFIGIICLSVRHFVCQWILHYLFIINKSRNLSSVFKVCMILPGSNKTACASQMAYVIIPSKAKRMTFGSTASAVFLVMSA